MADVAQTKDTSPLLSTAQQNELSSQALATKFLNDVSQAFKGNDNSSSAGAESHDLIYGIKNDPIKQQVLNQIATDMNSPATMQKLGLSGSVQRNEQGHVVGLEFGNTQPDPAYQNDLVELEKQGKTPTQAQETYEDTHRGTQFKNTLTYNTENPAAPERDPRFSGVGGIYIN